MSPWYLKNWETHEFNLGNQLGRKIYKNRQVGQYAQVSFSSEFKLDKSTSDFCI